MKNFFLVFFLMIGAASACASEPETAEVEGTNATVADTKPIMIPLDQIWALDMPGTRDIEGIGSPDMPRTSFPRSFEEFKQSRQRAIEGLRRDLSDKPPSADAFPGFVVSVPSGRTLLTILNSTIGTLKRKSSHERKNLIQSGRDAYLIFYSHPSSYYVQLKSVTRHGTSIDIEYAFVPHYTVESTAHFAMIPLGKLEAGEYQVRISQQPMKKKYMAAGFGPVSGWEARRFICQPFSFTVFDLPALGTEEDPVAERIPLDQIWALDMPGTRDVRELDPRKDVNVKNSTAVTKIRRSIFLRTYRTKERPKAGPCFLVPGEGKEALQNAAKVLVDNAPHAKTLPAGEKVSLVFYSQPAPGYVALHSVRHSDNHITVRYQVITHQTANATVHFALIPLGKLPAGKATVEVVEVASETPYSNHALTDRAVCDSCTFTISEGVRP